MKQIGGPAIPSFSLSPPSSFGWPSDHWDKAVTDAEAKRMVVTRWLLGHDIGAIMVQCICLGAPMTKAKILSIVRHYVDSQTENKTYGKRSN